MRTGGRITSAKRYKIFVSSDKGCSTFNQEKALVGAFFVIVKTDGSFAALVCTGD